MLLDLAEYVPVRLVLATSVIGLTILQALCVCVYAVDRIWGISAPNDWESLDEAREELEIICSDVYLLYSLA